MSKKKNNIEVEVRSFLSPGQYQRLLKHFGKAGKFLGEENQLTYYFSGAKDLRIQKTDAATRLWLKGGKIHQKYRKDIVVECRKEDFGNLEELLWGLGYKPEMKWVRARNNFSWRGVKVSIDSTKGYGQIIELEKMVRPGQQEKAHRILLAKMEELGLELTPRKEFDKRFAYYKKNWRKLI